MYATEGMQSHAMLSESAAHIIMRADVRAGPTHLLDGLAISFLDWSAVCRIPRVKWSQWMSADGGCDSETTLS